MNNNSKPITLVYHNDNHRGPGKVVNNLKAGLELINVSYRESIYDDKTAAVGLLQYCNMPIAEQAKKDNKLVLIGPNVFVTPDDDENLCKTYRNFVVPSIWVKEMYQSFEQMKNNNIFVWPVGIDTDYWNKEHLQKKHNIPQGDLDCFIYFKNRSENDLALVEALCRKFDLKYEIIKYGSYNESDLEQICLRSQFCILLTGTESQGVAYQNILSANVPCYVFNSPIWTSSNNKYSFKATSVPYWDNQCGETTNNINLEHFEIFLAKLQQQVYFPRNYIIKNLDLEKQAKEYVSLLGNTTNK